MAYEVIFLSALHTARGASAYTRYNCGNDTRATKLASDCQLRGKKSAPNLYVQFTGIKKILAFLRKLYNLYPILSH